MFQNYFSFSYLALAISGGCTFEDYVHLKSTSTQLSINCGSKVEDKIEMLRKQRVPQLVLIDYREDVIKIATELILFTK